MAREFLVDISGINFDHLEMGIEEIRRYNPQRFEMEQLDGVLVLDRENGTAVAYKDVREDSFWIRGHIPGRPLLPGVLMIESAAQLCSLYYKIVTGDKRFLGFGGVDAVKFRGAVVPGDRLIITARIVELRSRKAVFDTQGAVGERIVFEGRVTGMPV